MSEVITRPFSILLLAAPILLSSGYGGVILEFAEPPGGSVHRFESEIPIVIRVQIPGEIASSAEMFVDGQPAGTATYCCPFCPCFAPTPGMLLELRVPRAAGPGGDGSVWKGISGLAPGTHLLTATAVGSGGTQVESTPVIVTVLEAGALDLQVTEAAGQLRFILPGGSLVPGGFNLWVSHNLADWANLGAFEPGDVAAFHTDVPDPFDTRPRYYVARPSE